MATQSTAAAAAARIPAARQPNEFSIKLTPFDQKHYLRLIEARAETLERVVRQLKPELALSTVVDAGCGVGFFAKVLENCGLNVCGFDGRQANVEEARNRFPGIPFEQGDIQQQNILELGKFDLVVCFGLLYHLESPLLAIRNLRALTKQCLLLESMCLPDESSSMLLREEPNQNDQSLTDMACYTSEAGIVKMLYRAGYSFIYRIARMPDHDDFRETAQHVRRRTMLLASLVPIDVAGFRLVTEPREKEDPWAKEAAPKATFASRVWRFLQSPFRRKYLTLAMRGRRVFPQMPIPLRLPFGAWWLAENSALDHELMHNSFENVEMRFVERLVRPGMTVVDAGAHHGLYTLLLAKMTGRKGRVIAFEPSEREYSHLKKHMDINFCSNVRLESCALGAERGDADLFLVDGMQDWCNSLRPPDVADATHSVKVPVCSLDEVLQERGIRKVDFLKLDVEGAELSVLRGARRLLEGTQRPAILVEVEDIRTHPWGYAAKEIVQYLAERNYCWFALGADSSLRSISAQLESYDANLVALPTERLEEFERLLVGERSATRREKMYKQWSSGQENPALAKSDNA